MPKNWLTRIDSLRRCLPIARSNDRRADPKALHKLIDEVFELAESEFKDLTKLADVVYYAAGAAIAELCEEEQAIEWVEQACKLMPDHEVVGEIKALHAYRACVAKYTSRVDYGKNKLRESAVVALAVNEGFYKLADID